MKNKKILTSNFIAHRGLHYAFLENTIPAFQRAIERNYLIELDVQLSRDKEVMVFHDRTLKRLFGNQQELHDLTLEELKKYGIPTLKEVLKFVDGRVPILIELKLNKGQGILEKATSKLLDGYKGLFAVQSFNPLSIFWFRLNRPYYVRGYLVHSVLSNYSLLRFFLNNRLLTDFLKPDFIGVNLTALTSSKVKKMRKKYLLIGYTIDNEEQIQNYATYADNFICDIPRRGFGTKQRDCSPEDSLPKRIKRVG